MTTTHDKMLEELSLYYGSPASIQQVALDLLEQDIVDASNPFMFLLEASATNTQAAMLKFDSVARARYPKLATDYTDLYHHMADTDYLDRFAQPTSTTITLVIPTQSLRDNAVAVPLTESKRITIPKDTQIKVGNVDWYLHYPVNINIGKSGGIQVAYDLSETSPLYYPNDAINYLTTNTVDGEMLVIHLAMEQLSVKTETYAVSPSTGFNFTQILSDAFYAIRAFHRTENGPWEELATTHSAMVYDATKPTLQLTVGESSVKGVLPDIYTTNGTIGDTIRIDVYTTKGVISMDLSDYSPGDYSASWEELGVSAPSTYVSALIALTDISIYGAASATGGRDALTFNELKERVIYRSTENRASITYDELSFQLADLGYDLSTVNNTLASRHYLCSKALPPPTESTLNTPIGVGVGNALIDDTINYGDVLVTSTDRQTLTPDTLAVYENGGYRILNADERVALTGLNQDQFIQELNEGKYFYIPFFYVLDKENGVYDLRAYTLDVADIVQRAFIYSNQNVWFTITTNSIGVSRLANKYTITVNLTVPEGLPNIHGQLRYVDVANATYRLNETNSTIQGSSAVLTFELDVTYDIDANNRIEVTNLFDISGGFTRVYADLLSQFDIFYYVESATVAETEYDSLLRFTTSDDIILTNYEQFTLQFGKRLERIHSPASASLTPAVYSTYEEDQYLTYEKPIYARGEDGELLWTLDEETNKPVFTIEHEAGDVVVDESGPVVQYPAGSAKRDRNGNYIVEEEERLVWNITPLMLDARYYFATSSRVVAYRSSLISTVIDYLEQDIEPIQSSLLARSELFYLPPTSKGEARVGVEGELTQFMDVALTFIINYHLTVSAWESEDIKAEIESSARDTIREYLYSAKYSHSELTKRLKGDESYVLGVDVENPIQGYGVGNIKTPAVQWSIDQRLVELSNGTLDVEDAITVNFPNPIE